MKYRHGSANAFHTALVVNPSDAVQAGGSYYRHVPLGLSMQVAGTSVAAYTSAQASRFSRDRLAVPNWHCCSVVQPPKPAQPLLLLVNVTTASCTFTARAWLKQCSSQASATIIQHVTGLTITDKPCDASLCGFHTHTVQDPTRMLQQLWKHSASIQTSKSQPTSGTRMKYNA